MVLELGKSLVRDVLGGHGDLLAVLDLDLVLLPPTGGILWWRSAAQVS